MCYVYEESAERDARWARVFDLEQNIRDNMASEVEIALYVRGENAQGRPLEDVEIDRAGIARQGTRGQVGVMLGRYAADGVLDALRNGMPLDDAVRVVEFARVDRDVQLEGLRVMRGEPDEQGNYSNPGSITEARNVMRRFLEVKRALADAEAAGEQGSLFGVGFGESLQDKEFNRFFGRYQNQRMREIAQDKSYLNKLVGSRLSPRQAEKYGVDVKDPDGLKKRLDELSALYERWKNPALHPDLMEEMRTAFKEENAGQGWLDIGGVDAPAEVPASLQPLRASFSVSPTLEEDVGTAYRRQAKVDAIIPLCSAPRAFHTLGLPTADIVTEARVIIKLKNKHGLSEAQIIEAVHGLDDPLLIIREKQDTVILFPGGLAVNKLGDQGDMIAPVKLERTKDGQHFMASLYPLDNLQKTINLLKQGKLIYSKYKEADLSTEKAPGLSPELLPQLARVGFREHTITEDDIVKKNNVDGEGFTPRASFSTETIRKGFDGSIYSDKELASVLNFYGVSEPSLDTVKAIWKEVLNAVYSGNLPEIHDQMLPVSPTPAVLRMLGVPNLMMATAYQVLKNVGANSAKGGGHHLHYVLKEHMEQLPEKMEDPLAILIPKKKLKGQRQAFVFLTDMVERRPGKDEGSPGNESNIIVAVHVDVALNNKGARINKIASVYGKEEIRDWKYAYINNKLLDKYPVKSRLQLPSRSDIERGAGGIILTKEELVKWKSDNKVNFSLGGERADTFGEMQELGLTYFDPADGKRKFCLDSRGVRLSGGFTRGQVLGVKEGKHLDVSLKALVAFPELFRAYPELARLRVRIFNGGHESAGLGGYYAPHDRNGAHIAVNAANLRAMEALTGTPMETQLLDTLLHEAQHAIQHHEGWSRGAGDMDRRGAQKYLAKAILARKERGLETDWAKDNLAFMEDLLERVSAGDARAVESVYWLSHGEQEARFAGSMYGEGASEAGLDPMKAMARMKGIGVSAVAESWMTVPVPAEVTELGGMTFGQAGKYARIMDNRLAPLGDFQVDRRLYQKREAVMRRLRELRAISPGKEGAEGVMLEAVQVAHELVSALPKEYGFGLEPYEVWLSVFSKLGGDGSPEEAAGMAPMRGWNRTMLSSFHNILGEMLEGRMRKSDEEFWAHDAEGLEVVERLRGRYEAARAQAQRELEGSPEAAEMEPLKARAQAAARVRELMGEDAEAAGLEREFFKHLGKIKVERVLARMMERVVQRMDEYRKDRTLGRIRRVVDAVYPRAGKDGKPVKGVMDAAHYRRLAAYMRLLEMRKGEWRLWMEEHYPEGAEARWEDEPLDKKVVVTLYDAEGKPEVHEFTVAEVNTFACYEGMDAARAEAVARALGEFIATGRHAWENVQAERRAQLQRWAEPLLEETGVLDENEMSQIRKKFDLGVGTKQSLFAPGENDVQFFDTLSAAPALKGWVDSVRRRLAHGDAMYNGERASMMRRMVQVLKESAGCQDQYEARDYIQECREERDTGIVLVEQEPDFFEAESAEYRRQVMGLLQRKVQKKNYREKPFALALRVLLSKNGVTDAMRAAVADGECPVGMDAAEWARVRFCVGLEREALDKYGMRGRKSLEEARSLDVKGKDAEKAFESVFTERERRQLAEAPARVAERVARARAAWEGRREESARSELAERKEAEEREGRKPLTLSRAQAAYIILLGEQADYTEMLRLKGYTPEVMERLREFAGEDLMQAAYGLREVVNERTPELEAYYERKFGMPFPKVDNYFRAVFDAGNEMEARDVLQGYGGSASGGGKEAVLRMRSQSPNKQLDLSMDVFGVYALTMQEQSVILNYGDIARDLSGLLNFRDGKLSYRRSLEKVIGRSGVGQVEAWAQAMNLLAPQMEQSTRDFHRVMTRLAGVAARSLLAHRAGTNLKQFTALFNSLGGSEYVNGREWWRALGRVAGGRGVISLKELAKRPALAGRFRGWGMGAVEDAVSAPRGKKLAGKSQRLSDHGMELLEKEDAACNVFSSAVLYDAVYRKMKKENPELTHAELDAAAMAEVELGLARKSQPLNFRQKALDVTKMSIWKLGGLFMGSESINTFNRVCSLARQGGSKNWMKVAQVWLTHGILLQLMQATLDWLTDDEKQRKKRSFQGYMWGALLGPLSGIPFVSQGIQGGIMGLEAATGTKIPVYACSGLMPFADLKRTWATMKRDLKVLSGDVQGTSWEDRCLAYNDLMRASAQLAASGAVFGKEKGAAVAYGSALSAAAVGNVLDFVLKVTRTFDADRR